MKNSRKPPKSLSREARDWWRQIVDGFQIEDEAGHLLLNTAMESFDRMRQAQAILAKDGVVFKDRFGQVRQHPATLVERDAKNAMLKAIRQLNLDIAPSLPIGRPTTGG